MKVRNLGAFVNLPGAVAPTNSMSDFQVLRMFNRLMLKVPKPSSVQGVKRVRRKLGSLQLLNDRWRVEMPLENVEFYTEEISLASTWTFESIRVVCFSVAMVKRLHRHSPL